MSTSRYPADYFTMILPALSKLYALEAHYDDLIWDSRDQTLSQHYVIMKATVRSIIDGHRKLTDNPPQWL